MQRTMTLADALRLIAVDARTTLGWELRPEPDPASDGAQWFVRRDGAEWIPSTPVASLPGWIQHEVIDTLATAWPRCPAHRTHPLRYTVRLAEGIGTPVGWHCEDAPDVGFELGALPDACGDPLDPVVPANTVRWYLRGEGWGVIAGEGRDLWFNVPSVRPEALPLAEGDRVMYDVDERPHDAFPARAARIRRAR